MSLHVEIDLVGEPLPSEVVVEEVTVLPSETLHLEGIVDPVTGEKKDLLINSRRWHAATVSQV